MPRSDSPVTLTQIHTLVGGTLHGSGETHISHLGSLGEALDDALSFVANDQALRAAGSLRAGALLCHRHIPELSIPQVVVQHPLLAFAQVAQTFFVLPYRPRGIGANLTRGTGVKIGADPSIWPFVTLGDHVTIGARVTLYPGVFVGSGSSVGDDSILYPNVVIREECSIGARVFIHSGTVIGSDGFGYVQHQGRHHKIPQLGGVVIEDDVELGANVTIDRATLGQTIIKKGTKVDNLVQIAHNVTVGEHAIVVAQVGIAGSTTIDHHVMIGGQAGLADHIHVGAQVMIAARAGVNRSLEPNQIVSGAPVMPHETWMKAQAVIPRLPELRQSVRSLEQRMAALENLKKTPEPRKRRVSQSGRKPSGRKRTSSR
ncbi:UDP-3-O-(3-hydroxymyristoyl)glucosamine N-acyltransferase [Nitrospira sp. KM1]|uniref:UDP-3-O-(3-hydroxymyristoyl)glucosamine N-acyltransferase n=1 Tax=Nitrospira sp. KM1 TaxID=1936990 RepID=UPI001566DED1|nr:UDP-3-O-(3-hydroxymyristoyl)glucosamine N-acyltransferase [Nitrospira sp. KM1]